MPVFGDYGGTGMGDFCDEEFVDEVFLMLEDQFVRVDVFWLYIHILQILLLNLFESSLRQ